MRRNACINGVAREEAGSVSDLNYDEFVDLVTEHFRTNALLGDALTIGHEELTTDQTIKYT